MPGSDDASIEISEIKAGPSIRLGPLNSSHLECIAGLNGEWPPILISKDDATVIDGNYRLAAAKMLGYQCIPCQYVEGSEETRYLEALRCNVGHGLPLTLRERKNAAARLLEWHPEWSDRKIGEMCGLAHETVGAIRLEEGRQSGESRQSDTRIGRDNKRRSTDPCGSEGPSSSRGPGSSRSVTARDRQARRDDARNGPVGPTPDPCRCPGRRPNDSVRSLHHKGPG